MTRIFFSLDFKLASIINRQVVHSETLATKLQCDE